MLRLIMRRGIASAGAPAKGMAENNPAKLALT
jgi:hypothetical protein